MASELAAAYIALVPSFKGGAAAIQEELGPAAEKAGTTGGQKAGEGFKGSFSSFFKGAGAATAIFGGIDFVKNAFGQALDAAALPAQLQQEFGLTKEIAASAAKTAGTLYAQGWGESLNAIGDAVAAVERELNNLGTGEDTARVTTQAQAIADTFGQEVGPAITAASQMVKTGLADSMEQAFDIMTRGFQEGANSGDDFIDTIIEYSGQFEKLGLDGTTAMGLINQALAAGARNSDFVADAIKEFSIRAVDGSKTTSDAFKAIGLNADVMGEKFSQGGDVAAKAFQQTLDALGNMENPLQQSQAAVGLFGTKAEDLGAALFAMNPAAAAARAGLESVGGAAQGLTEQVGGTTQASLEALGRTFQTALGNTLAAIVPLVQAFLGFLAPILPILGPMTISLGALALAVWAVNAAMNANPFVLIGTLIVGLIATVLLLWNKFEGFREAVRAVWGAIQAVTAATIATLTSIFNSFVGFFAGIPGRLAAIGNGIWNFIVTSVHWAKDQIMSAWNAVMGFFAGIPGKIGTFFRDVGNSIFAPFRAAFNGIANAWNNTVGRLNFSIPSWVPLIGGKSFGFPKIPTFAEGGIATQATLGIFGEAGAEAVMPLDKLDSMLSSSGSGNVRVVIDGSRLPRALEEWLRRSVRVEGGGSVQRTFGR